MKGTKPPSSLQQTILVLSHSHLPITSLHLHLSGGASGLGDATARLLHSKGAYVGIWDLNEEGAQAVADSLNSDKLKTKRAMAFRVDVCEEDDVVNALKECDSLWKGVQIGGVINCGGVAIAGKVS